MGLCDYPGVVNEESATSTRAGTDAVNGEREKEHLGGGEIGQPPKFGIDVASRLCGLKSQARRGGGRMMDDRAPWEERGLCED